MKKAKIFAITLFFLICCTLCAAAAEESYIVKLKEGDFPAALADMLTEVNADHRIYTTDNIDAVSAYGKYIEYTEENKTYDIPDITPSEDNGGISTFAINDPYYSRQWQVQTVNAEFPWYVSTYGNGVNVAVIDSGCYSHSDLEGVLKGGKNVMTDAEQEDYTDNNGHGTHVTGIIAAQHNRIGTRGISPKVNLYAIKITDTGKGIQYAVIADAIYAAVDDFGCRVINMSLAGSSTSDALYEAIKYAYDKGVFIICAAGNEGDETYGTRVLYPAGYDEVIAVGAVTDENKRADFSQKNDTVFVSAPGYKYVSLYKEDGYATASGTSQAAPIVTAAAAILLSADPDMTFDEFRDYIRKCSAPLEDDYTGCGLINIEAMLKSVMSKKDCYISPMNDDGVYICNNTEEDLYTKAFFTDSNSESPYVYSLWLMSGGGTFVSFTPGEGKVYLWTEKLRPLCLPRKYNN